MPQLPNGPFGPIPASVVLNGSGAGTVTFQPNGKNARISNLFGKVSTSVNQATVSVYLGQIADSNRVFNNNSGSTGFSANGQIDVQDGQILYVVWTGGDAGATATATFSGTTVPFGQGDFGDGFFMEATEPIAAGDGSLIFPALKSPNYTSGSLGWYIARDGTCEFANATIRGTFSAANGLVTIDNGGLAVQDTDSEYEINRGAGFLGRPIPNDGRELLIQYQGIYFHLLSPSAINALTTQYGSILPNIETSGSIEFPYLRIRAPYFTGKDSPIIKMYAQGSNNSVTTIDLDATQTRFTGILVDFNTGFEMYGKGYWGSPAIGTGDTDIPSTSPGVVLFTYTSITWKAGRAYKVRVTSQFIGKSGSAGTQPLIVLRTGTTTTGTLLVDNGRLDYSTASSNYKIWEAIFIVGASDVTKDICVTGSSSIGGIVTMRGSGNNPSLMEVFDIGPASRYPGFATIT